MRDNLKALGLEKKPATPHDLRRTAATHMARLGIPDRSVGRVLNHGTELRRTITSRVYIHYDYTSEKRQALEAWANELSRIVSDKEPATNVVKMRGGSMSEELEDHVAEVISRQAMADLRFAQLLSERLVQSLERFKNEGDGGTQGALQAIRATRSYLQMKRPDWAAQGLLNPIAAIEECLSSALNGKHNNILKDAWTKRPEHQAAKTWFKGPLI